jgi:hypothetical protein
MTDYLKSQVNNLIDVFDNAELDDLKKFAINLETNVDTTEILSTVNELDKMNSNFEFNTFDEMDNIEDDEYKSNYFDTSNKNKIKKIINEKKKIFNKNKEIINRKISQNENMTNALNNLNKLNIDNNNYETENKLKLVKENNNSKLNYRKSYYEYQQIENVKYFNKMFNYIYYIFLLIFVFYTLIRLKDYKSPVTYTLILILLLLPILIVPLIVKSIFTVYEYFIDLYDTKVPKDVFTNI